MSLHKITAGVGYDYLTRQVAAMDSSEKGHTGLASYYEQKGESPGVWVGSGLAGIDGLAVGDPVSAEQMRRLFGAGEHPLADDRLAALPRDASEADRRFAVRLGAPFKVFEHDVPEFQVAVAKAFAAYNSDRGLPWDRPVPAEVRARIRSELAAASFTALNGRPPRDARELHGHLATLSRPQTTAVAGFDLTFSPVKSVSTVWALADLPTAARVERAHNAAVADALRFIEARVLFTRTGRNGVRQVDVTGLVGTAFTHRDSRAGDPDLHTHVAVANKVQTLDGRWLAIDGRMLFKAMVAASEVYNTALEGHLAEGLGVRFEERSQPDARKRPVREIVGVEPALTARWSARRAVIEDRQGELAERFQSQFGRPPTAVETSVLAQQATLETRPAKHSPRSLAEQRVAWRSEADAVLGAGGVERMLATVLAQGRQRPVRTSRRWVRREAARIIATVEGSRSTWQDWHVRAEALRVVRQAAVPPARVEQVVGRLVHVALTRASIPLAAPADGIVEPPQLRRLDGLSVYTVAGATWHTSTRILAAEQRLVDAAGRTGGHVISDAVVDVALLEAEANRTPLNAGQAALVRAMGTSGRLVQLAIAPAGAGKTTAMRTLAHAWQSGGGTVIGLAPSASAAAQLGEQIGHQADTLALLTHALATGRPLPAWARAIGPQSLVIIDEAGMADTLTLDRVVEFVLDRGGSVRLIGDTQQLAAIGAGGVLRDIDTTHGALRLDELVRFADPAEAAASLALRDGDPSALGFYLDQQRIQVGDETSCTSNVFHAWATDRAAGLDALMLAPTRELVADLNQRAQAHLHGHHPAGPTVSLADGNTAGVGDVIITRTNNRRLATTARDWVKNGDRWHITHVTPTGAVRAVHQRTGHPIMLPSDYVAQSVDLGYACTIHTAQGVTADTMHGVLTGTETRQQLYTMLTRGRLANHAHLQVVGDGDPHTLIKPEAILPPTATDLLEAILARDEQPTSATSTSRTLADPTARLADATARYTDAVHHAAETTLPAKQLQALETLADQLVANLTDAPAWPTLRAHLILDAAHGINPVTALQAAVAEGSLADAADPAAVLVWRLNPIGRLASTAGPLPWLPGIPTSLTRHPDWAGYLQRRHGLVTTLADQVRVAAITSLERPGWLPNSITPPDQGTIGDVAVWRAAHAIPDHDTRPTGDRQHTPAERRHQVQLEQRVVDHLAPGAAEWTPTITALAPATGGDPSVPVLAHRLAQVSSARLDAAGLLRSAINEGELPDHHPAAALWWRISRHINPAVATRLQPAHQELLTNWLPDLERLTGPTRAAALQQSEWWPPLVTTIENALARGWRLDQLITPIDNPDFDDAQALVWRTNLLLAPVPDDEPEPAPTWETIPTPERYPVDLAEPDDPYDPLPDTEEPWTPATVTGGADGVQTGSPTDAHGVQADEPTDLAFTLEAQLRRVMQPPEPSEADVLAQLDRAYAWLDSPHTPERLAHVNELAAQFYEHCYRGSWAQPYLTGRVHTDLTGHPDIRPGYAPNTWTALINHLHHHGVTDAELVAAGLAKEASTGRLIDRFRDRVVFPITHEGQVLGFVGRRNPDRSDDERAGPKYLNTPDTLLFHKRAQLYVVGHDQLEAGATPVIVEGPMDAIAITTATGGRHVGVAPLGTSLSTEQAVQLRGYGTAPIIATDNDPAGQAAADRDFWTLTHQLIQPRAARLPDGTDPADLVATGRQDTLVNALDEAPSQAQVLIDDYFDRLPASEAAAQSLALIATRLPEHWEPDLDALTKRIGLPTEVLRPSLLHHIRALTVEGEPPPGMRNDRLQTDDGDVRHAAEPMTRRYPPPPPPRRM